MKDTRKPRIRFKEFNDSWEQRKLTDFVDFYAGLTYAPSDVQEIGTLVLRSSNVSNGEIVDADNVYVCPEVVNVENVQVGDIIVVVRNGSRSLIGKHAQIKRFMPNTVIGAFMTGIRSECPEFTNALLNTPHFDEEISLNMGATINQITGYMFSKMEFHIPNLDEQNKIGDFFENLDNLITLHQRECEKLLCFKKSMLEKMFPKNGEKYPEIRFSGFTDSWEQRKLGDIAKFINGRAYAQNELLPSGKYKVLRVGNFYTNDSWYYSDLELDDKYYANDGDLLYTWSATFGPHIWRGDRVIYHYHIWKIDLTDELEKHFAVQLLEQDKNDIISGHNGSTMAHITKEGMEQKKVVIPKNIGEQRQLGLFFDNLDNLITLHQREVEKLVKLKKSMLEKMFI